MQIVIDIDVDFYDKFIYGDDVTDDDFNKIADIMASGTPLPIGHGRLVDAEILIKDMKNGINAGLLIDGYEKYININSVDDCVFCVECADTVLEADKEV